MKPISVRRTPKSAYNPKRRVSDLLKAHISNLEAVTSQRTGPAPKRRPKTEAQASAYIEQLTRQLHPDLYASATLPAPAQAPAAPGLPGVDALKPPPPATRRRRTAGKKKTATRSASTRRPSGSTRTKGTKGKKKRATRRSSRS